MTRGEEILNQIQKKARTDGLEASEHGKGFVLKGGILLAAYGARRPTKDVDSEAIGSSVTAGNIAQIVRDIAAVGGADGVAFDLGSLDVQEIREEAEYPGLRVPR